MAALLFCAPLPTSADKSEWVAIEISVPFASEVALQVYDLNGHSVSFQARNLAAGLNQVVWSRVNAEGKALPSGTYMLKVK